MESFGFQWHLTNFCNLRCNHCYQDDFSSDYDLDFESLCKIADKIFNHLTNKRVSVNLTGGEPLLYAPLFDLIKQLASYKNLNEINIISNGTINDKVKIIKLSDFCSVKSLKVSVESVHPEINDQIRGNGNFGRVLRFFDLMKKYSNKEIHLMVTLTKYNYKTAREILDFAKSRDLDGVIFERFVPIGRGKELASEVLTQDDWMEFSKRIIEHLELDCRIDELLKFKAFWFLANQRDAEPNLGMRKDVLNYPRKKEYLGDKGSKEGELRGAPCNLGDESMAIMPDGVVFPCRRLPIPIGNILHEPFDEILSKLSKFLQRGEKNEFYCYKSLKSAISDCENCMAITNSRSKL